MRIVGRGRLNAFCQCHPDARSWIEAWLHETEGMSWKRPQDIKARHVTASFLSGNVVIVNVRGNNYRLEAQVAHRVGVITVLWIGSHVEYDVRNRRK